MENKSSIFNFISNSYSQFLNMCPNHSFLSQQEIYMYAKNENGEPIDVHQLTYARKKKHAKIYQNIFFGLSILFFVLATIIYFNTTNWACSLYFKHCTFIKAFAYSSCFCFSFLTFFLGYLNNPEKETAALLIYRMKKHLKNLYKQKRIETGTNRIQQELCKQSYDQALDKIQEHKEHIFHILDRILYSNQFDLRTKEQLILQAFTELQNALNIVAQSFKKKCYLLGKNSH